VSRLPVD